FRGVLLDEYQETSHAQVVLLCPLCGGGHPGSAGGVPCQSVYGWRGAGAGALARFPGTVPGRGGRPPTAPQPTRWWCNRPEILAVANALAAPLRAAGARVATLAAAPRPAAPLAGSTVACALTGTLLDEAEWIADRVASTWRAAGWEPPAGSGESGRPAGAPSITDGPAEIGRAHV